MMNPHESRNPQNLLFVTAGRLLGSHVRFAGISRHATQRGWSVQVVEHANADTNFDDLLSFWKPLGVILEYGEDLPRDIPKQFTGIPTVCLDRNPDWGGLCICQDSRLAGETIARELSAIGTFSCFGYVGFPEEKYWDDERREGFRETLAHIGRSCEVFDARRKDDRTLERELDRWLAALPRPCGLMASNDNIAARVLGVCARGGISVPNEIAVVGVDNVIHVCETTTPTLSSVEPDFEGSGYLAAQTIDGIRNGRLSEGDFVLRFKPVRLVRRASSAVLRRHDPAVARALEHIRTNAASGLRVSDVLGIFGCSRRSAEMRFRRSTGIGIFEAISEARLELAKTLLSNRQQAVGPIAAIAGFGTEVNFHRAFLRATGQTPGQWRRNL